MFSVRCSPGSWETIRIHWPPFAVPGKRFAFIGVHSRLASIRGSQETIRVHWRPFAVGLHSRFIGNDSRSLASIRGWPPFAVHRKRFAFIGVHSRLASIRGSSKSSARVPSGTLAFEEGVRNTAPVQPIVAQLTDRLIASYRQLGGINHLDGKNLPSKRVIADLTSDLLRLLFPGFFDEKLSHSSEIKAETTSLLERVLRGLEDEVRKSLEYRPPPEFPKKDWSGVAHTLTVEFLESLPRIREMLQTDTDAAYSGDPAALSNEEVIVAYPFIEAIAVQRLAHELYLKHIALIPRIMTEWAHARTGMDLHPGAQIGTHFFVDHCTGTVVGETSIIGNHVKMYQGVGLVARSLAAGQQLRGHQRHPRIEDRVTIYAGATIMGGDTVVGEGSTIGANVFLTASVPPHSLVVQEDANVKVMRKKREAGGAEFQI
jgi:serine O-acetyltransferase